jgi:uroporphyrin-III C-methyltransferase/precorrin-2 dehydrogenase/sirohydrochlorin ferrochelatase
VGRASEGLTVAVTAGGDPRRAAAVRDGVLAALDSGTLPVRRVRQTTPPDVPATGRVALVGGGPGAEDLITVRGRALLAEADVVVTDRLGPRSLLGTLAAEVEVVDVGKTPGNHPVSQERINELLVHHASLGKRVVRLKGGDPFVLGRGGEEALHCAEHGIPVEVVPGVTSAVSVPAAAGIPVTHRGITASFVVASAHDGADAVLRAASDAAPDATLVLLMGVTRLGDTAQALIRSGRRADTPVALVERGWTPEQRTTVTTLERAAEDALAAGVRAPAVVVVGDVVSVRNRLGDLSGE